MAQIDVYVKLPTGRNTVYYVSPCDTIETVCKKIAEEEKVKPAQVRLKYQGKNLDRSHTMSYLGVRPETILKAEILVPRPVTLTLSLPRDLGETEMTSTSLDTVDDIIARVADIVKEEKSRVVLQYNGRPVRGLTLMDAGLVDGSALKVEICDPPKQKVSSNGASVEDVALDDGTKQAIMGSFVADGKPVEVVFSFDTTGSMFSILQQVRTKLKDCCTRLMQDIPNIRIGIVAHGDYCDEGSTYVIRVLDLTSDTQAILDFVSETPRSGGCGPAACYEWVLRKAQGLDWSENSAKALVVIGDEKPHAVGYTDAKVAWQDELEVLTGMGVKVYGVRALDADSKEFYEEIAEVSGGHYLQLGQFDVITDMFLAVCYRESQENANDALEAFAREVEDAGRMTDERKAMFEQLGKESTPDEPHSSQDVPRNRERPRRHVTAPWWDASQGNQRPLYHYDAQSDNWIPYSTYEYTNPASTSTNNTSITTNGSTRKSTRTKGYKHRKCSIM